MEAHVVRDGAIQSDDVPVAALRSTVSGLDDGAWVWVDAVDPDHDDVAEIQRQLDLHDLAAENVRHRNQRPKLDLYPGHAFAVFRPLAVGPDGLAGSEVFVFASPRVLVTLRFAPAFDLAKAKQRWPIVCSLAPGTAAALYAIADEIVDDYLDVVEQLEEGADELESQVFRSDPEPRTPEAGPELQLEILRLRRDAVQLRRHAVPMRQLVDRLADDSELVTAPLVPYLRDITDHLLRAIELTDGVREILTTVVDIRMAQSAHQLNEVMKKLTAWAAIILVPTLVAGIYGMNFRHMPELRWVVGYPLALGLMAASSVWLYLGFRKRGWL
jgi:magnesium transporter